MKHECEIRSHKQNSAGGAFEAAPGQLRTAAAAQLFILLFSTVFRLVRPSAVAAAFLTLYS